MLLQCDGLRTGVLARPTKYDWSRHGTIPLHERHIQRDQ